MLHPRGSLCPRRPRGIFSVIMCLLPLATVEAATGLPRVWTQTVETCTGQRETIILCLFEGFLVLVLFLFSTSLVYKVNFLEPEDRLVKGQPLAFLPVFNNEPEAGSLVLSSTGIVGPSLRPRRSSCPSAALYRAASLLDDMLCGSLQALPVCLVH